MGRKSCVSVLNFIRGSLMIFAKGFLFLLSLTISSCGGNLYESMSTKDAHDALMYEVKMLVNQSRFSEAVEVVEDNPSLNITDRGEKMVVASAYAGACGVTFADLFESLSSASGSPMFFMMSAFQNKVLDPDKCNTAQSWIASIGNHNARTTVENIAMFLVGLGKVGTNLRYFADTSASGIGDGTVDAGFDSCDSTDLPRANVKQILSGFALLIENVDALGSNVSANLSTALSGLSASCTLLGLSTCTETDASAVTNADADSFRDAIKSDKATMIGIETCSPLSTMCC